MGRALNKRSFQFMYLSFNDFRALKIPPLLTYWFDVVKENIYLRSNALTSPRIKVFPTFEQEGNKWIYTDNEKLVEFYDGKTEVIGKNTPGDIANILGLDITPDKVFTFSWYTLTVAGKKVLIHSSNGIEEFPHPKNLIPREYGSILKYKEKCILYTKAGKIELNSAEEVIYSDNDNLIYSENGGIWSLTRRGINYIGYCEKPSFFLGMGRLGYTFSCNGLVKVFLGDSWKIIGRISNPYASYSNFYLTMLTGTSTEVFDSSFYRRLKEINRISAGIIYMDNIIMLSKNKSYFGVAKLENEIKCININSKNNFNSPAFIEVDKSVCPGEVILSGEIDELNREYKENTERIFVVPRKLTDTVTKITLINPFDSFQRDVTIESVPYEFTVLKAELRKSINGVLKEDRSKNSLLLLEFSSKVPSPISPVLHIEIGDYEFEYKIMDDGSNILKVPVSHYSSNEKETVNFRLIHAGSILFSGGVEAKVIEVRASGEEIIKVVPGLGRIEYIASQSDGLFVWEKRRVVPMTPVIRVIRNGGTLPTQHESKTKVNTLNERNEIEILAADPLHEVGFKIVKDGIAVVTRFTENVIPIIINGPNVALGNNTGETILPIEPTYPQFDIKYVYYGIEWSRSFRINVLESSIAIARRNAEDLLRKIDIFGYPITV
ncbi:hypothetical protein HS7_01240 [Sulfolobales archaeon HS-7]|nr:hypothetical protein HS7_01240 [Sulfolobales archaeon HS-7]